MPKQFINPPSIAPGRGYAHGVKVGNRIYVAGQIALDQEGKIVGEGDFAAQVERVFQNVGAVLEAGGARFSDVVKMNSYLTRQSDFAQFRELRRKFLGDHTPASTAVVVSALAVPGLLLEVEVTAEIE
ncbi:MAG TPA: RidA family protein [Dehalococcoidia bacterium]|nr:RidA family protein [Dehalococcoidia bacterium]